MIAVVISLFGVASADASSLPNALTIPDNYDCRQTFANYGPTGRPSWVVADRGHLTLHVDSSSGKPSSYHFNAFWLTDEPRSGAWSWNGLVKFNSGPLALRGKGFPTLVGHWSERRRVMPHDTVRGRAAQLVLRSLAERSPRVNLAPAVEGREGRDGFQRSYWYCGLHGLVPRQAFARDIPQVQRRSGIKVRLPSWFEPLSQGRETGERGRVRVATKGLYRLEIVGRRCAKSCPSLGIFSAKRASAGELGHRKPVRLARGIRGWVGNVGCGPPGGPDWGPVFCGGDDIVWHAGAINYAIELHNGDDSQLIRYANQTIRYG